MIFTRWEVRVTVASGGRPRPLKEQRGDYDVVATIGECIYVGYDVTGGT